MCVKAPLQSILVLWSGAEGEHEDGATGIKRKQKREREEEKPSLKKEKLVLTS